MNPFLIICASCGKWLILLVWFCIEIKLRNQQWPSVVLALVISPDPHPDFQGELGTGSSPLGRDEKSRAACSVASVLWCIKGAQPGPSQPHGLMGLAGCPSHWQSCILIWGESVNLSGPLVKQGNSSLSAWWYKDAWGLVRCVAGRRLSG